MGLILWILVLQLCIPWPQLPRAAEGRQAAQGS